MQNNVDVIEKKYGMVMEKVLFLFKRIQFAFSCYDYASFLLKPKQVKCFESFLLGENVIAVLPTGYGKSLLFHLLPDLIPVKDVSNIVIVVTPLNSIIENQVEILSRRNIPTGVLIKNETSFISNSLFANQNELDETKEEYTIPELIVKGKCKLLFCHPEAVLSKSGRALMKSDVYQKNVVACVIDEAHCIEMWGKEFRTDYMELSTMRAIFPNRLMLVLTATAPPAAIESLKKNLCLQKAKVITASPNRANIFISKDVRLSNSYGLKSYDQILVPIAKELEYKRQNYPMTIIYMKLKYCGYAYKLFEQIIKNSFNGTAHIPEARLFQQYHAPATKRIKTGIMKEISSPMSRIRVIFATTALGMGVDAPGIENVIHIKPPTNLECYMQEFGRAGRTGLPARALLYFNNSDLAKNQNVEDHMKEYCKEDTKCLRNMILSYFGSKPVKQEYCCSNCNAVTGESVSVEQPKIKYRKKPEDMNVQKLITEINTIIKDFQINTHDSLYDCPALSNNLANMVVQKMEYIKNEEDFIDYGIWNDTYSTKLFDLICRYAPSV